MITIERQVGQRYRYYDDVLGIEFKLKQLHIKHFDGSGHLEIWGHDRIGVPHRIYGGRTPITSTTAKKRIAEDVEQTLRGSDKKTVEDTGMQGIFGVNTPIILNDWKYTVHEALEGMLDRHYRGDPPINLFDEGDPDEDVWRVPPILSEDINLIYGNPGSGKSYLSIILGQAINQGIPICGLPTKQGKVLLIDYETTKAKMMRRFYRVNSGLGITAQPILYMGATVPLAQRVESLQEYIMEFDIDFIIVDSLARACGGSITDDEGIGLFFEAIRQLERACLIIHHTNRADTFYGSSYILANARNMWRLTSATGDDGVMSLSLTQEKENDGPNVGSLSLSLTFKGQPSDPDAVILDTQDPALAPAEVQKTFSLFQQLLLLLKEAPEHHMSRDAIVSELSLNTAKKDLLRNYFWSLRKLERDGIQTTRNKQVADNMHVKVRDGVEYLCLNTDEGYHFSSNGVEPTIPVILPAITKRVTATPPEEEE